MDTVKPIRTRQDYEDALAAIGDMVDLNPAPGSAEADRLEVLTLLLQDYEAKHFPLRPADPLVAIRFRMEQQGLLPRDLVPYLGSRSKASEVLSGKRELTLSMIRALHQGLGIPAEALLAKGIEAKADEGKEIDWTRFPLREMASRGWIKAKSSDFRERAEELVREFLAPLGGARLLEPVLYRKSDHVRAARSMDMHALAAWTARVMIRAQSEGPPAVYNPETVTPEFMRRVAQLSTSEMGPIAARDFLAEHGIPVVVEPHLAKTHLDGAAFVLPSGSPVIGLTLRYDRLDNFWFTLMHELAHVGRHLTGETRRFYDDLESESGDDPREREADALAGEALIPTVAWKGSPARSLPTPDAAEDLAQELGIHPAIVAGRIQHERSNYKLLHQLVGRNEVRRCFPDVTWE
jgi:HTH-type transcriptional regulator / antitoxin HigA